MLRFGIPQTQTVHHLPDTLQNSQALIVAIDPEFQLIAFNRAYQKVFQAMTGQTLNIDMSLKEALAYLPAEQTTALVYWKRVLQGESFTKIAALDEQTVKPQTYAIYYSPVYNTQGKVIAITQIACDLSLYESEQIQSEVIYLSALLKESMQKSLSYLAQTAVALQEYPQDKKKLVETIENEERCRALLELSNAVIWSTDSKGLITTLQSSWEKFSGQSWEDYKKLGWASVVHPDDREALLQRWEKAITERCAYEHTARLRHHNGSYFYMLVRAVPLLDQKGEIKEWVGLCLDIHNSKFTEMALRDSEQQLRELTNNLPQLVWTTQPSGEVQYYNLRWKEYTGFQKEHLGWGWTEVLHPDDYNGLLTHWENCRTKGQPFQYEVRMRRHDGVYRWHTNQAVPVRNQQGEIIRWLGTCTDIHDLKETTAKLSTLTERLNLTLKSAQLGIWNWDLLTNKVEVDDKILELFHVYNKTFQYTVQEIFNHIHEQDRVRVQTELQQCIQDKKFYDVEFQIQDSDPPRFVAGRGKVYFNQQGQPIRIQGINWDVTARKQLEAKHLDALKQAQEQECQRTQQAIEHRQKQEEFIDTICHEIRNPLNGIYGGVGLMADNLSKLDSLFKTEGCKLATVIAEQFYQTLYEAKQNADIIKQCAQQQKSIVDDVLDLSKLEQNKIELNPVMFSVKEQLHLVVQMLTPQINQKSLKVSVEADDKWIKADAHRFTQIMTNLVSNAVKFTHEGTIKIKLVMMPINEASIDLAISVTDTGIGMSENEIPKLFERFTQANRRTASAYGGSGLGLVITKKLVETMGGNIRVKSQKWHGTCFEINLKVPALSLQEQQQINQSLKSGLSQSAQTSKVSTKNKGGSKRILVVEDNPINQKILTNLLNKRGHLCEIANNGAQALEKYGQFSFDCIFMDIEMPVMNGLDATRQIRLKEKELKEKAPALYRHTLIIGLSGNARKEQVQIALDAGMDGYLTKPLHAEEVYQKIEETGNIQQPSPNAMETSIASESLIEEQRFMLVPATPQLAVTAKAIESSLFIKPANMEKNETKESVNTSTVPNEDELAQKSHKKLRVSPMENVQPDLLVKNADTAKLIDSSASAFQSAAHELLAQAFTFELTGQQNVLYITFLKAGLATTTPYMAKLILEDLKQKIESTLTGFNIQNISLLHNNQLAIITHPAFTADLQACLIKAGLFVRKDYSTFHSAVTSKAESASPLLSCPSTLFSSSNVTSSSQNIAFDTISSSTEATTIQGANSMFD